VTDKSSWSQFGIAFNENEANAQSFSDSTQQCALASSGGTFKQDMPISIKCCDYQFNFTTSPDDSVIERRDQRTSRRLSH
jgi:hypothetical protein